MDNITPHNEWTHACVSNNLFYFLAFLDNDRHLTLTRRPMAGGRTDDDDKKDYHTSNET